MVEGRQLPMFMTKQLRDNLKISKVVSKKKKKWQQVGIHLRQQGECLYHIGYINRDWPAPVLYDILVFSLKGKDFLLYQFEITEVRLPLNILL